MLSRIAESLYWIGRYTERAETTARLLDVHYHAFLEGAWIDEARSSSTLLQAMGAAPDANDQYPDSRQVTDRLAFDGLHQGSVVRSLEEAWENARGAREVLSAEIWESMNETRQDLVRRARRARDIAPHVFFEWVRDRSAILGGLAASTLSRDDSWHFLALGWSLERIDMVSRIVAAAAAHAWGATSWTVALRSCAAQEAFARTHRAPITESDAAGFLLLDRLFPRSAIHALGDAEDCLQALGPTAGRVGWSDEARRVLGRLRAELEYLRPADVLVGLEDRVARLEEGCGETHAAIAQRYFQQTRVVEWSR